MPENAEILDQLILETLQKDFDPSVPDGVRDQNFNSLALRLFTFQFSNNLPYRRYCENIGVRKNSQVKHWTQIPFLGASSFKEMILTTFPHRKAALVFHTSGTSRKKPGRLFLENSRLYEAALLKNFLHHFSISRPMEMIILTPSIEECPYSSLSYMASHLHKKIGKGRLVHYLKQNRILFPPLFKRLRKLSSSWEPVLIFGTAFSLVYLLDEMRIKKIKLKCAPGSLLMETGGFKGLSEEIPKDELYGRIHQFLGIAPSSIINEYGMTEMASQFYDHSIKKPSSAAQRCHRAPPWVRTRVLDPRNLDECPVGKIGLLQHYDLANRSNVMGILTEDIAMRKRDGFQLIGRVQSQETRGCSIAFEEWIQKNEN